jgi:hypothetical protein
MAQALAAVAKPDDHTIAKAPGRTVPCMTKHHPPTVPAGPSQTRRIPGFGHMISRVRLARPGPTFTVKTTTADGEGARVLTEGWLNRRHGFCKGLPPGSRFGHGNGAKSWACGDFRWMKNSALFSGALPFKRGGGAVAEWSKAHPC